MPTRGERNFLHLPGVAARMYDLLTKTRAIHLQYQEVAHELTRRIQKGRLLDIGMGPGSLLREVHRLNPEIELFGLDISQAMVTLARKNLSDFAVDIRHGSIQRTDYANDCFDLVTCTGSFYLWDEPVAGLNEIYRVLKSDCAAVLYESHRDFDEAALKQAMRRNLQGESFLRRIVSPFLLEKQLRMTYSVDETAQIIQQTRFARRSNIEKVSIANLPAWIRITLSKP